MKGKSLSKLKASDVFKHIWLSRMTGRNSGRGKNDRHAGGKGCGRPARNGYGLGYSSSPKPTKLGLCKDLEGHIFNYGGHRAADTMRT